MKKFFFSLFALLAITLCFTSCGDVLMEELKVEDVDASWCNGLWDGTLTTTITNEDSVTVDLQDFLLTPAFVITEIEFEGSIDTKLLNIKRTSSVKANPQRTKLYIKTTNTVGVGDYAVTTTLVYDLEKQ